MKINSNSSTLSITRNLEVTSRAIARSLQRLSTGSRLTQPADDLAAFSEGVKLDSKIRGQLQATQNINSAMSLLQTADSAIASQLEILQRMREIAVQAGNSLLTTQDRSGLNSELTQLYSEFSRISSDTEFNNIKLLDGSFGAKDIQLGANAGEKAAIQLGDLSASKAFVESVGSGTFQTGTTNALSAANSPIASGDFDGKNGKDVAAVNTATGALSIMLNNGSGKFTQQQTLAGVSSIISSQAVDINKDGILDIVEISSNTANGMGVFFGNGDGSFQSVSTRAGLAGATNATVADFNGDGAADLLFSASANSTYASIALNNGDGTFSSARTIGTTPPGFLQTGDFNGDGKLDFIQFNDGGYNTFTLYQGDGQGGFTQGAVTSGVLDTVGSFTAGDINGDGKLDLVAYDDATGSAYTYINNGSGVFTANAIAGLTGAEYSMRLVDVNRDGAMDLVSSTDSNAINIIMGNNGNTFTGVGKNYPLGTASTHNQGLIVDDFSGDKNPDILASLSNSTLILSVANTVTQSAQTQIKVSSATDASRLLDILDNSLKSLTSERARIGASTTRLESSYNNNQATLSSVQEAKSTLLDFDVASATAELVRNQILQQSQVAALGQANLQAQLVLNLLSFN